MVDVSDKPTTTRTAVAEATLSLPPAAAAWLDDAANPKGDPLAVAELAGVMGAKRTADLIPLCHPLPLANVEVRCHLGPVEDDGGRTVRVEARCRTSATTGVEMEAMTAASVAALTLYDMLKGAAGGAADGGKSIEIHAVRLLEKHGGKSGSWVRS